MAEANPDTEFSFLQVADDDDDDEFEEPIEVVSSQSVAAQPSIPSQPTPADSGSTHADSRSTPADSGPTPADSGPTPADSGPTPAVRKRTLPVSGPTPSASARTPAASARTPAVSDQNRTANFLRSLKTDRAFTDKELYIELEAMYHNSKRRYDDEKVEGISEDGTEFVLQKLQDDYVHYNRVASVYTKSMQSMFIVPVWASAFEKDTGYILYPKLLPLSEFLKNAKEKKKAVRQCLMPVAAAIDSLHTPVPNRRPMYYHRDVCIGNVYMPSVKRKKKGKKDNVSGLAKLKLTRNTRGSYEHEVLNSETSITHSSFPLNHKYYHHPDPWSGEIDKMYQYLKKHDWFSFGVYILEVMGIVLEKPLQTDEIPLSSEKIDHFCKFKAELEDVINEKFAEQSTLSSTYKKYLEIARWCLNGESQSEVSHVEYEYKDSTYHFEYPLSEPTAHLLCMFDQSASRELTFQDILVENVKTATSSSRSDRSSLSASGSTVPTDTNTKYIPITCQSCHLRDTVPLPTRSYKGNSYKKKQESVRASKCDPKKCNQTYCVRCYVNGERLFCPQGYGFSDQGAVGHGTTSTIIGHRSSYALIMYGDHFTEPEKSHLFERDADMLRNVLEHRLICGIPKENIVHTPLYSKTKPKTAIELLKDACDDLVDRIHRRSWNPSTCMPEFSETCVNDGDFCVYVFYSGHGCSGDEKMDIPYGSWVPSATFSDDGETMSAVDFISQDDLNQILTPIRRCTSENDQCSGACIEVVYVMDYCRPPRAVTVASNSGLATWSLEQTPSTAIVASEFNKEAFTMLSCDNSEITFWFCTLMRSIFPNECAKVKENCKICNEIRERIDTVCYGTFIDGKCLELHMAHMKRSHKYRTKVNVCVQIPGRGESDDDSDDERDDLLILAHYNEGGVYYRVFPYREGDKVVEIDFSEKITCANLIEHVRKGVGQDVEIRLLTNNPGDSSKFSLVCDHTVSDVLHSTSKLRPGDKAVYPSILYYQTIKQCIEIELFAVDEGAREGARDTLQLCLDENDADRMVNEMSDNPLRLQIPARQLPNLLVYILHHLRHLEEYELDPSQVARQVSRGSPTDSTMAPSEDMYPTQIANASMEERARNSLASYILGRSVDLKEFKSAKDWLDVEEKAAKYLSSGVQKIFHVYKVVSGKFRIEWPRKEP